MPDYENMIEQKIEVYQDKIKTLRAATNVVTSISSMLGYYTTTDDNGNTVPDEYYHKEYDIITDVLNYLVKAYLK